MSAGRLLLLSGLMGEPMEMTAIVAAFLAAADGQLVLAAATVTAGRLLGLLWRSLGPMLLAGVTVAGTGGLTIMLKEALGRSRPPLAAADGHAFPSAHAAAALAGVSRVYLGVHWATDVIGGWAGGVLWLAVVVIGWTIVTRHRHPGIPGRSGKGDSDPGPSLPGESALETGARVPDLSDGRRGDRCDGSTA